MTQTATIFECEICERFFDESRQLVAPRLCVPELFLCGRADCKAPPPPVRPPVRPAISQPSPAPRKPSARRTPAPVALGSCPRDDEREFDQGTRWNASLPYSETVGSSQSEFTAAVDNRDCNQVLLEFFREHYAEWIPMVKLAEVAGVHALHSRIPEVRGLLNAEMEDIDQENRMYAPTGRVHSHYRICRKEDSVRLKRQRDAALNNDKLRSDGATLFNTETETL